MIILSGALFLDQPSCCKCCQYSDCFVAISAWTGQENLALACCGLPGQRIAGSLTWAKEHPAILPTACQNESSALRLRPAFQRREKRGLGDFFEGLEGRSQRAKAYTGLCRTCGGFMTYEAWPQYFAASMLPADYTLVSNVEDADFARVQAELVWFFIFFSHVDPGTSIYDPGTAV